MDAATARKQTTEPEPWGGELKGSDEVPGPANPIESQETNPKPQTQGLKDMTGNERRQGPPRRETDKDQVLEFRLAQLEKVIEPLKQDLSENTIQIREMHALLQQQSDLRTEIEKCRADHNQNDVKLWEKLDTVRSEISDVREDLIREQGRVDNIKSISKPVWIIFSIQVVQVVGLIWSSISSQS